MAACHWDYGGLIALIGLSLTIEGSNAGFWRAVLFLVIGMIAFGFGTLYLQRQGGPSGVLEATQMQMQMVQGGATYGGTVQAAPASLLERPLRRSPAKRTLTRLRSRMRFTMRKQRGRR